MKVANLTAPWHSKGKKEMVVMEPSKNVPLTLSSLTHRTRLSRKKKKKKIYLFGYSQPVFHKEITTKHTTYVWFVKGFSPLFDSEDFYM